MKRSKISLWVSVILVAASAWASPAIATSSAPTLVHGHQLYGAKGHFNRFAGVGYQLHHGPHGETDVNVCSSVVPVGHAACNARVVVTPAITSHATSAPISSSVSSCSSTDTNAPSTVISGGNNGYDPCYLQSAYNAAALAQGNGGVGQIVAIVDYSIDPNIVSDLATYRAQFGLPACPTGTVSPSNTGCVLQQVAQSGAPVSGTSGWDAEISLDVDAVSAICPKCQILLEEASSASLASLGSAVNAAVSAGAIAVSNSYGGGEYSGESADAATYYQHPGVAITVSSGDTAGAVEFPASAPDVIAVGGTTLLQYSPLGTRSTNATETVWSNSTGGAGAGCSGFDSPAAWQSTFISNAGGSSKCSKRITADVSAVADPYTGLWIYDSYGGGGWAIYGGTSLASPITAALYGLSNNATGSAVHPAANLYAAASSFYHVTSGNVGSCGNYLCDATKSINGFNGPTGIGTPGGSGALAAYAFNPATPPAVPATPATPTATSTATTVTLNWTSVTGAASYNVYAGSSANSLALVAPGVSATTYTATGLTPSSTYYYAIAASNTAGTSALTTAISAATTAISAPSAPTGLTATGSSGSVTLSWTAPLNNGGSTITGYTVYYATTSGGELTGTSVAVNSTSTTISSLTTGSTYYFVVEATNNVGSSVPSSEVSGVPVAVPTAPTVTSILNGSAGSGQVTMSWSPPTSIGGSALTGYAVYYGTTANPTSYLGTVTSNVTRVSITNLTPGTTYYFDVVATNAIGSSPASNVVSITCALAAPGKPGNVKATASGTSVKVTWSASSGSSVTYQLLVSTSSSMSNATSYAANTATNYTVTGLATSTTYYFQVKASNSGGSSLSAVVSSKG